MTLHWLKYSPQCQEQKCNDELEENCKERIRKFVFGKGEQEFVDKRS